MSAPTASDPLEALRRHPQLNQLKQAVKASPGNITQVIAAIAAESQEYLNAINANKAAFVALMQEPIEEEEDKDEEDDDKDEEDDDKDEVNFRNPPLKGQTGEYSLHVPDNR
jgi:hypothetical protein